MEILDKTEKDKKKEELIKMIDSISPKIAKKIALNQLDVALVLGVSSATLDNMRRDGIGPRYVKFGKRVLYPKVEIVDYLVDNLIQTN